MKTTDPARYFRNIDTPAARLARWQEPSFHRPNFRAKIEPLSRIHSMLDAIRKAGDYTGKTLAEKRRYLIDHQAPELSSPEAEAARLWIDDMDRSPLVLNYWKGRDFLNHRGWYTDEHQDDTLEAYAVQLEAFPHLIFEAIRDSMTGTVRVMLEDFHAIDYSDADSDWSAKEAQEEAARDAIRSADSTAEREAEEERRYQAEEDRKRQAEEARDDLKRNRSTVRALVREFRELCGGPIPTTYPAAASAVKRQLADLLKDRSDLFDQLKTLEA